MFAVSGKVRFCNDLYFAKSMNVSSIIIEATKEIDFPSVNTFKMVEIIYPVLELFLLSQILTWDIESNGAYHTDGKRPVVAE